MLSLIRYSTALVLSALATIAPTVASASPLTPQWPQKWSVNNQEPAGFGFPVTQPGPVTVTIESQGPAAPITAVLLDGSMQTVQQQSGVGGLRLSHVVTPAELRAGSIWQVRLKLAQPAGPPVTVAGIVAVQSPPADEAAVQREIDVMRARPRPAPSPEALARAKADADAGEQAVRARFQQQEQQRREALDQDARARYGRGGPVALPPAPATGKPQ